MSSKFILQNRRGTEAQWTASEIVPYAGEIVVATDTHRTKIGDGVHTWASLPFSDSGKADQLTTPRTITLNGDVAGSVSFDGSANVTLTTTVADDSHNHIIDNIDNLQDALDTKANVDGYYAQLGSGTSDQLNSPDKQVQEVELSYRTSGGDASITDGNAEVSLIKGRTTKWNQLISKTAVTTTINGITFTNNNDGSWTVNGTATSKAVASIMWLANRMTAGKWLILGCPANGGATEYYIASRGNITDIGNGYIENITSNTSVNIQIVVSNGTTVANKVFKPQLFDLTEIYGAGNEPTTVEQFRADFPKDYYEYDPGSLKSFDGTGIKTVGFNAFNGTYARVVKGAIGSGENNGYEIVGTYTAVKFSETVDGTQTTLTVETDGDISYIVPPNNGYVFIEGASTDTCLHLRWSGYRNGEYEEYWTQTRNLPIAEYFPNGMNGTTVQRDELTATKAITRTVKRIFDGTENWLIENVVSSGTGFNFYMAVPEAKRAISTEVGKLLCSHCDAPTYLSASGFYCFISTAKNLNMNNNASTSLAEWKSYLAEQYAAGTPVTILYLLETPTEVAISPPLNLLYPVSDFGTEEIVYPAGTENQPNLPLLGTLAYQENLRDELRYLKTEERDYEAAHDGKTVWNNKADVDGVYDLMTVGASKTLVGKGDEVDAEYTYRTTGGSADVADGTATVKSIKGNTLVWNQLAPPSTNVATVNGVTFHNNGDGSCTVDGTATARVSQGFAPPILPLNTGKYLVVGCPKGGSQSTYNIYVAGTISNLYDIGNGVIADTSTQQYNASIRIENGYTVSNLVFMPQIFNLTRMFGAGNEPSTVAEFRALFPKDYYEHDAGSLLSFVGNEIKTVGFNQLGGGTWLVGQKLNSADGLLSPIATSNTYDAYIRVVPGKVYYYSDNVSVNYYYYAWYDADKNFIERTGAGGDVHLITVPTNAHYLRIGTYNPGGSVAPTQACLNLSWSGYRNGEYEPYRTQTRNLPITEYFPNGMRSAGDAYDELTASKAVTRIGVVNLGDLTWTLLSNNRFYTTNISNIHIPATVSDVFNGVCNEYTVASYNNTVGSSQNNSIAVGANGSVWITDTAYTDAVSFKTALSGKYLCYELETQTEVAISPELNLSYLVSDFGTEEIVTADNAPTAPCNMDVVYGLNAADTIRRLPENYVATTEQTLTAEQKAQIISNLGIMGSGGGTSSFVWKGVWSSSVNYVKDDIVQYEGSSYIATSNSTGLSPEADTVTWNLMAKEGGTGAAGVAGANGTNGINGTDGADGTDGVGIQSVEQTTTSSVDNGNNIVTVTLTNGETSTFTVKNGSKGTDGAKGDKGDTGEQGIQGESGLDLITPQDLTAEEKQIARTNIDAPNKDGCYPQMFVGRADTLLGADTETEYIYHTTNGTADVADGVATVKSVKGNTIVWNQCCNNGMTTQTKEGITFTVNNDGSVTANGTAVNNAVVSFNTGFNAKTGHKYLVKGCPAGGNSDTYQFIFYHNAATRDYGEGNIADVSADTNAGYCRIMINAGVTVNNIVFRPQLFDLTKMFGTGNEPTSVAEFKALFPKDYYEYDAGSLLSFVGNGIKTVGFNLFDEETKLMAVDGATKVGDYYSFPANKWHVAYTNNTLIDIPTDYIGQIEVKMNAYASNTTAIPQVVFKYADGTKSYESFARTTTPTDYTFISTEGKRVVAVSGAYYANGTVYVKDFCIHLVWSGYRNGEYEDYWTQTRNLPTATYFPNGMRSAGDAYDELTASKAITRISVKVLDGTETIWLSSTTDSAKKRFLINCENAKRQGTTNKNIICNYYTARSNGNTYNCNVGISPYDIDGRIVIYDDRYTTIDDFKAYLAAQNAEGNPVILYYEVATPTEVAISPELNLSYLVSDFGTEEILTADDAMTAPCRMTVAYCEKVKGIESVEQTTTSSADGGNNIVTITLSNGETSTFTIKNGSKGSTGERGLQGERGLTGAQGAQGIQGAKGDKGDTGDTGVQGVKGDTGATGTTFTPVVSSAGVISWANDGGKTNPSSVDLVAAVIAALPDANGGSF